MTTFLTAPRQALRGLLLATALLLAGVSGWAQPVQSPNFVAVTPSVTPLYAALASTTTANRLPVMYRATISGLTASTLLPLQPGPRGAHRQQQRTC